MIDCNYTQLELKKYGSGCGSNTHWLASLFRIPRFVSEGFYQACNEHDVSYVKTDSMHLKQLADDNLYDKMYYDAFNNSKNFITKSIKIVFAEITYKLLKTKISD